MKMKRRRGKRCLHHNTKQESEEGKVSEREEPTGDHHHHLGLKTRSLSHKKKLRNKLEMNAQEKEEEKGHQIHTDKQ